MDRSRSELPHLLCKIFNSTGLSLIRLINFRVGNSGPCLAGGNCEMKRSSWKMKLKDMKKQIHPETYHTSPFVLLNLKELLGKC